MSFIEKLTKKPKILQRIIGLKIDLFNKLVKDIEPLWEKAENKRLLSRQGRKRGIGAGNKYKLAELRSLVAVILFYYKSYLTQELLGLLFDLDQSNISRLLKKMLPLIEEAADPELRTFLAQVKEDVEQKRINSLEELFAKYPDLKKVAGDVTEQQVFRSQKYEVQKEFYSGKKKQHTIKTNTLALGTKRIVDISKSYPGSVHDKKIMDTEKAVEKVPEKVPQLYDLGFQGIKNEYPNHNVTLPIKKPKGGELTPAEKEFNKNHSKSRVIIENTFCSLKKFRILSQPYRQPLESYNQTFRNVAALHNFRLANASPNSATQ